ncbi:hypothetical protein [Sphingomonas bacterium]|uniref:hypothetical protein n=1 Tax=Sphingomonas bacterium TaxID=1895847 RepID=UPI00157712B5|nr:hypothetical protein [Sphingomonas bacterium]
MAGVLACASLLQGCATYSFAPPKVEMANESDASANFKPGCGVQPTSTPIAHSIDGAGKLIDNFLYAYRCAEHHVANGRQHFEVPAMAIAIGGAAAMAAGAPAGVAIGTGAATAGLNGFKGYYAPKDKLPILAASVDALVCIKNQSVGVDAYGTTLLDKTTPPQGARGAVRADPGSGTAVAIKAVDQYYELIVSALLSVENVAAQRLSSAGGYSPDAIITEFKAIEQKRKEQEEADKKNLDKAKADAGAAAIANTALSDDVKTVEDGKTETRAIEVAEGEKSGQAQATPDAAELLMKYRTKLDLPKGMYDQLQLPNKMLALTPAKKPIVVQANRKAQDAVAAGQKLTVAKAALSETLLYIGDMQVKLNECVLRAKI